MPRPPDVRPELRLLHYWWPVAMGGSSAMVVQRATGRPLDGVGFALLLFGILAAYSLDRILEGPEGVREAWLRSVLLAGAVIGIAASVVLLTLIPVRTAVLVPVLGLLVLAYPRLKSLPLLKTAIVPAAWTWSLIALPFHAPVPDASWLAWRAWTAPVAIPLTLIVASGCLLCDLKDVQSDRDASVRTLPVLTSAHATIAAAVTLAAIGASVALAQHRMGLAIGGLGLGLAAMRPSLLAQQVVGPLLVDVILTVPGILVALHIV